jgi:hypothetical protein
LSISVVEVVFPCASNQRYIPHVGGWLNGRNKFKRNVAEADERNDAGGDVVVPISAAQNAADEEVDCVATLLAMFFF